MFLRTASLLCLAMLVAVPAAAADKDQDAIQGSYTIEKALRGGEEMPADMKDGTVFEFKGNQVIIHEKSGKDEPAEFTLDSSKSPKSITIKPAKGAEKQVNGIYKLEGDTLSICFAKEGDAPAKFESEKGSMTMLIVLKRKK